MSLIKDIKEEQQTILKDKKTLRKFGFTIGGILLLISVFLFVQNLVNFFFWLLISAGSLLVIAALFYPSGLRSIYFYWMTAAIILGWFVSRVILILIFYLLITPVGIIARLFKKEFLDLKNKNNSNSYWILKEKYRTNYRKMY